jgi:hypothetical protein
MNLYKNSNNKKQTPQNFLSGELLMSNDRRVNRSSVAAQSKKLDNSSFLGGPMANLTSYTP